MSNPPVIAACKLMNCCVQWIIAAVFVLLLGACGGGGGSGADGGSTSGQLVTLSELGVLNLQVPAELVTIKKGESLSGLISWSGLSAQTHQQIALAQGDGVLTLLAKDNTGAYPYKIDASQLDAGVHEYAIKLVNSSQNKYAVYTGRVTVVEPLQSVATVLTSGSQMLQTELGDVEVVGNAATAGQSVEVNIYQTSVGASVEIKSKSDIAGKGLQIKLPVITAASASPASVNRLQKFRAQISQWGKSLLIAAGVSDSNQLNEKIYEQKTVTLPGKETEISKSLGQQVLVGAPVWMNGVAGVGGRLYHGDWVRPEEDCKGLNLYLSCLPGDEWRRVNLSQKPAFELHTSILSPIDSFVWTNHEPVLFVHGYSPSVFGLGGGQGTWDQFPKLVQSSYLKSGKLAVPFEFHWHTHQSFRTAADDLAAAIEFIHTKSGQPVHIVAHSFGGVLSRTLLQGESKFPFNNSTANKVRSQNMVASLVTLGSPHSGISRIDGFNMSTSTGKPSVTVPQGADLEQGSFTTKCGQISCYEMGEDFASLSEDQRFNFGLEADFTTPGRLIERLNNSLAKLPTLPIHVQIGLNIVPESSENNRIQTGDTLISFAGQRFNAHASKAAAKAAPLLNEEKFGNATVTEMILGLPNKARPGDTVITTRLPTARPQGYYHSSTTRWNNLVLADTDKNGGTGLMAAPSALGNCSFVAACKHAGYAAYRQMQDSPLNPSNTPEIQTDKVTAYDLTIAGPYISNADLKNLLDSVKNQGLVSGKRIAWERLSAAERQSAWGRLAVVPDSDFVKQLAKIQTQGRDVLMQTLTDDLKAFNASSTKQALLSKEAVGDWVALVNAQTSAVVGIMEFAAGATGWGTRVSKDPLTTFEKNARIAKFLKSQEAIAYSGKVLSFLSACVGGVTSGTNLYTKTKAAFDNIKADDYTADDLVQVLAGPTECLASMLKAGEWQKAAIIVDAFNSAVYLEGQQTTVLHVTVNLASDLAALLPGQVPAVQMIQGVLDYTAGIMDVLKASAALNQRADAAFALVDIEKITTTNERIQKLWLEQSILIKLKAKSAEVFVPVSSNFTLAVPGLTSGTDTGISSTDGVTNSSAPTLTGTAPAYSSVDVYRNGSKVGSAMANASGVWTFNLGSLAAGSYAISVTVTQGGVSVSSPVFTLVIDLALPPAPVISKAEKQSSGQVLVSGMAEASAYVLLTWPDGLSSTVEANSVGQWSTTSAISSYSVGTTVRAKTQDPAGNQSTNEASMTIAAVAPSTAGKLPHTGITANQCYQAGSNALVSCTSAGAIALSGAGKQDGMYANVNPMSYSKVGFNGEALADSASSWCAVKDKVTGLLWQNHQGTPGTYTNYGDNRAGDASKYATDNATLCGLGGWRLPTVDELETLVDASKPYPGPTINTSWFANTPGYWYWSSSPNVGNSGNAWGVVFYGGVVSGNGRGFDFLVRLVRAGQ